MESPPKDLPDLGALLAECNKLAAASSSQVNAHCHKSVTTAQVHRHSSGDRSSVISKEEESQHPAVPPRAALQRKSDAGQYNLGGAEWNSVPFTGSPESPKSSDLWQPISPRLELRSPAFTPPSSQPTPPKREDAFTKSTSSPPSQLQQEPPPVSPRLQANSQSVTTANACAFPTDFSGKGAAGPDPSDKRSNEIGRTSSFKNTAGGMGGGGKTVGFQSEKSESSRDHDDDDGEITTEMKISEDPTVTVEDVPMESKGLFFQSDSFDEEGDLPCNCDNDYYI